jgi:hypothetical protein
MVVSPVSRALHDQYEFTALSYAADTDAPAPPEWFTVTAVRLIGEHWHFLATTTEFVPGSPARTIVTRMYVREKAHIGSHGRIRQRALEAAGIA